MISFASFGFLSFFCVCFFGKGTGAPGSTVSVRASVASRDRFRRSEALIMVFRRDVMRSWIVNCVFTPATLSPAFLALPFRLRRFLFLLLYLKVKGSINEGPLPAGKGQKLSRKDFQPVEGVMGVDGFAVCVGVISAPRD